jgi:hypothetical protein
MICPRCFTEMTRWAKMSGRRQGVALFVWTAAWLALTMPVRALPIYKFDGMSPQDQDEYLVALVQGAEKVLRADGRPEDAARVGQLFKTNADNAAPIGLTEFMADLAAARVADANTIAHEPHAQRLQVEHALIAMLKKHGVVLPRTIMTVMNDFRPKFPTNADRLGLPVIIH